VAHKRHRQARNVLPSASRESLPGQQHNVEPEAIAPVLAEFFAA
jgi:hypothetical protein